MAVGAYPGSFNPPTVAHLAIAEAALEAADLARVDLVVSESALGKEEVRVPSLADRIAVLEEVASSRPWLGVRLTRRRLLADISEGYDALVVGADKWAQLLDPAWYHGSCQERDRSLARLPTVLVVDRPPYPSPELGPRCVAGEDADRPDPRRPDPRRLGPSRPRLIKIRVDPAHGRVSSSAVRAGRREWMVAEAAAWDARTGGWSDPARYLARG